MKKFKKRQQLNLKVTYVCPLKNYEGDFPYFQELRRFYYDGKAAINTSTSNMHIVVVTNNDKIPKNKSLYDYHELLVREDLLEEIKK